MHTCTQIQMHILNKNAYTCDMRLGNDCLFCSMCSSVDIGITDSLTDAHAHQCRQW